MTSLPPILSEKLDSLSRQVRARRLVRGLSILLLVLGISAGLAIAADVRYGLTPWLRWSLFGTWLFLGVILVWRSILRPVSRPVTPTDLAAVVERSHPALAESLSSTVELAGPEDQVHGSPRLIELLARETEIRTRRIDFGESVPTRWTLPLSLAAAFVLALGIGLIAALPAANDAARRFFLPFYSPEALVPYQIEVTSGNPAVKRGEHVNLSGYVLTDREDVELPTEAVLRVRPVGEASYQEFPMRSDQPYVFYARREAVEDEFEYAIQAGDAVSDWHHVRPVDPVGLAGETAIEVTPPAYARALFGDGETVPGLNDVAVLQYGTIRFDLHFDREPASAYFLYRSGSEGIELGSGGVRIPVSITGQRGESVRFAIDGGTYQLVIDSADGVRTELPSLRVQPRVDQPPRFAEVTGIVAQPRVVPPGESLPISFIGVDDVAITAGVLEYRVDGGEIQTEPLSLIGEGSGEVICRHELAFDGKVEEGRKLEFRVKITDNREVPEAELEPQSTYYPSGGRWAELRIDRDAAPLKEQEIDALQQDIDRRLSDLIRELKADARRLDFLKDRAKGKQELDLREEVQIEDLKLRSGENARKLEELATEAGLSPEFGPLADRMRDVARQQLREAEQALRNAEKAETAAARDPELAKGFERTDEAVDQLEQLREQAEQTAQETKAAERLERLAREEEKLADEADAEKDTDELAKKQRELREELEKLAKDDPALNDAMRASRDQETQRLGDEARRLADDQRQLRDAMRDTDAQMRGEKLAEMLQRQRELTERLEQFAKENEPAARAAQTEKLDTEPAKEALEAMRYGELPRALERAERAAMNLDKLATDFEKAEKRAADPIEAARQLSRLQEDLRQRLRQAASDGLTDAEKETFQREQQAIRDAIDELSVPEKDRQASPEQQNARSKSEQARDAVEQGNTEDADKHMQETRDTLKRLADNLPNTERRKEQARQELARMRKDQENLAKQAKDASDDDQRQKAVERQAELAERLQNLDVPNQEQRRAQTAKAMREAAEDLAQKRTADIKASQEEAARQLKRLEEALAGRTPADEQADRLAKKQQELADEADRLAKKPQLDPTDADADRLRKKQEELARELKNLDSPEAPLQREQAQKAMERAQQAADDLEPERLARESKQAAEELKKLADQMNRREDAAERAERLARMQQEAAKQAEERRQESTEPSEQERRDAERLARQMTEELEKLRAGDAEEQKQAAQEAMERLRQGDNQARNAEGQREAPERLQRLAEEMAQNQEQQGQPQPQPGEEQRANLPSGEKAEQARELAREMRDLREEMLRSASDLKREAAQQPPPGEGDNPIGELAKQQQQLAEQAREMAEEMKNPQADQAARAAEEAARRMQNGTMESAKQAGQMAKQQFEQLAQSLKGEGQQEANDLARRQEELNKQLNPLADDPQAAGAQQQARQAELRQQAEELEKALERAAEQMEGQPGAEPDQARQAAEAARQAQGEMARAESQRRGGQPKPASEAQQRAAEQLERAAQQARQASGQQPDEMPTPAEQRATGQALREAMRQMSQADQNLGEGEPKQAGEAMKQAAEQLRQAAQQMARTQPGGEPPTRGEPGQDIIPDDAFGPEAKQYAGKSWGELPGEVRSRIIQGMRERYGIDDARIIKYYFEQVAERR